MDKVLWPFGEADVLTPDYAAEVALEIENNLTIIKAPTLTGALEFTLTADPELRPGAKVIIDVTQGATGQDVTFAAGGDVVAPDLTGVANDRDIIELTWDGSEFVGGLWQKVVDAA